MKPKIHFAPEGHNSISPYLIVNDAARALQFYKEAFGAVEIFRLASGPDKIMHAEVKIGDSVVMLTDECPEKGARGPQSYGGSPVMLHVYLPDVDARFQQAVSAGAKIIQPLTDQFYGCRSGGVQDPFGHIWYLATQTEILTAEQISERAATQGRKS